jgi:hypothetical protein
MFHLCCRSNVIIYSPDVRYDSTRMTQEAETIPLLPVPTQRCAHYLRACFRRLDVPRIAAGRIGFRHLEAVVEQRLRRLAAPRRRLARGKDLQPLLAPAAPQEVQGAPLFILPFTPCGASGHH